MKLPAWDEAVVSERKVRAYLLSPTHPAGRHKAAWLMGFAFTAKSWRDLAEAIMLHAATHEVAAIDRSPFGIRYVVEGALMTPDGRNPLARSVWFIDSGDNRPRFVTLYPVRAR